MKISVYRERINSAPKGLTIGKDNMEKIGEIVKASILKNIQDQLQIDGSQLKRNEKKTYERKLRLGRGTRSLVDKLHRFVKPANWRVSATDDQVTVEPTGELKDLVGYVQKSGPGGMYRGWFGINAAGKNQARKVLRDFITKWWNKG